MKRLEFIPVTQVIAIIFYFIFSTWSSSSQGRAVKLFFSKTCCRRNYCQKSFSDLTLAAVVSNVCGHQKYAWNQQLLHFSTNIQQLLLRRRGASSELSFFFENFIFSKVPKIILWSYNLRKSTNFVLLMNGEFCLCNPFGSFSFETFVNRLILI